jgi:hypothetical protein
MSEVLVAIGWAVLGSVDGVGAGPAPPEEVENEGSVLSIPLGWSVMNSVAEEPPP